MNFTDISNTSYYDVNTTTTSYDHTKQPDWLIPIVINVLCMTSTTWILVSLIHFGIKSGKWKRIQRSNGDKLSAGLVYSSVVGCAATCLVYYGFSNVYLNSGFGLGAEQDQICDFMYDAGVALYIIVILSVGLFIWFRQRAFYANRMYNVNFSKTVRVFSFISIFLVLINGIAVIALFVSMRRSVATSRGCTLLTSGNDATAYTIFGFLVRVLAEAMLLGLFLNALRKTRRKKEDGSYFSFFINSLCCCCYGDVTNEKSVKHDVHQLDSNATADSSQQSTNNTLDSNNDVIYPHSLRKTKRKDSREVVRRILRKTVIFGVLSLVIDVLLYGSETIFFPVGVGDHRRYVTIMSDINVLINLLLVIFSFVGWKTMLTSPCSSKTS